MYIYIYVYMYVYMLSRLSHVQLFVILWTVSRQAPLSMGFSRQEYWSGLPFPSPAYMYTCIYMCICIHIYIYI